MADAEERQFPSARGGHVVRDGRAQRGRAAHTLLGRNAQGRAPRDFADGRVVLLHRRKRLKPFHAVQRYRPVAHGLVAIFSVQGFQRELPRGLAQAHGPSLRANAEMCIRDRSTTVKMMSGILVPDAGEVRILGRIPHKQRKEHVSHIGVVFGQRSQLWWDTPVMDSFHLLRDIYRVRESDFKRRLEELTGMLDAQALLHVPVRQLSLGQRMKCELIAALLQDVYKRQIPKSPIAKSRVPESS